VSLDCLLYQQHFCQNIRIHPRVKVIASQRWDVFETRCTGKPVFCVCWQGTRNWR